MAVPEDGELFVILNFVHQALAVVSYMYNDLAFATKNLHFR